MSEQKTYTVYKHTSPNGKVYIGITGVNVEDRWRKGTGYLRKDKNGHYDQAHFARAILHYGWDNFQHEILFTELTKEEAEQKEIELIEFYNSSDKNYGYNMAKGGKAPFLGRHHKEETKQKISNTFKSNGIHQGKDNPMYGKIAPNKGVHCSDELKKKISDANKEYYAKNGLSEGFLKYLKKKAKKINVYDMYGNYIDTYENDKDVALQLFNSHNKIGTIQTICNQNTRAKAYKSYQFRYYDDYKDCKNIKPLKNLPVPIYELSIEDGNIINEYNNIKECSNKTNIPIPHIRDNINGDTNITHGRLFIKQELYSNEYVQSRIEKCKNSRIKRRNKKVGLLDENDDIVKIFDTVTDASHEYNLDVSAICRVCNGKQSHVKGYCFKYIDEN